MPRCRKILANGKRCSAKAVSGDRYCIFHTKKKPPYNGGRRGKKEIQSGSNSTMDKILKRRATVMAHQVTGRVATAVGGSMIASAAAPVKSRAYTMLTAQEVRRKGIQVNKKTTVYRPPDSVYRPAKAVRHLNRVHGKRVTRGPKKGQILRGDELRYYGRQQRRARVGAGLAAYGRSSKNIGRAHAYRPTLKYSPYDLIFVTPEEVQTELGKLKSGAKRAHKRTQQVAGGVATLATGFALMGGQEGVKRTIALEGLRRLIG